MKELKNFATDGKSQSTQPRASLLRRLNIPIEQIDYKHVESCTDSKNLEKILRILMSKEEGCYPDLESFVRRKLGELDPSNRFLRTELPIDRTNSLDSSEREQIETHLQDWIESCDSSCPSRDKAFLIGARGDTDKKIPIRESLVLKSDGNSLLKNPEGQIPFMKPINPKRIKSLDYDKWEKYDVETELTKLEIQDMRIENEDQISKKLKPERLKIENSKSNFGSNYLDEKPCCSKSLINQNPRPFKSFIEELPIDGESSVSDTQGSSKRRIRVRIDDVNAGSF